MDLLKDNSFVLYLILLLCSFIHMTSSAIRAGYNEKCSGDKDCDSGFCNPKMKSCDCLTYRDAGKGSVEKQFYDQELKMCFSKVGQLCTLPTVEDQLTEFRCVPEADCVTSYHQPWSKEYFGTCSCKYSTQASDDGKRCISKVELRTVNAKVSAMDQVRPEGWNRSGGDSMKPANYLQFALVLFAAVMCSFAIR